MMKRIRAALAFVTAGALLMFSAAQAPAAASA